MLNEYTLEELRDLRESLNNRLSRVVNLDTDRLEVREFMREMIMCKTLITGILEVKESELN